LSNFYCHPGRAGGPLLEVSVAAVDPSSSIRAETNSPLPTNGPKYMERKVARLDAVSTWENTDSGFRHFNIKSNSRPPWTL
jgi:hypothetical protein